MRTDGADPRVLNGKARGDVQKSAGGAWRLRAAHGGVKPSRPPRLERPQGLFFRSQAAHVALAMEQAFAVIQDRLALPAQFDPQRR